MIFALPLPPSVNHFKSIGLHGKPYTNKRYRDWKDECGWLVRQQFLAQKGRLLTSDLRADIVFDRRGDLDNRIKPVLDLLQDMGVYRNDKQIVELHARFGTVSGCEITVTAIE